MMFDRWRKLERTLYSKKENTFDISKIPDVYDSIKYDCIHNKHLGLDFQEVCGWLPLRCGCQQYHARNYPKKK
jgi:hypothetical protein